MSPDFEVLIDRFMAFKVENKGRSKRTADIYRLALTRLNQFMPNDRSPLDASGDELLAYTGSWLTKQGIVATSRRPYVAAVRGFFTWARHSRLVSSNPALDLPYPKAGKRIPDVITLANAEKLMWSPNFETFEGVRDAAMIALLIGCGIRVSGLVNLNVSHVIEHEHDGKRRLLLKVLEKGDKQRLVPVPLEADLQLRVYMEHPRLQEIDRRLPDGDLVLFVSVRNRSCPIQDYTGENRRLNRRSVLEMVKKYGRDLGLPEAQLHPHAFRHLYGTELAEENIDLVLRQRLMGHEDPKSTRIYDHTAIRRAVREVDRANPLSKIRTPVSDLLKRL